MKQRDLSIENISGLLIIYMILHHIFQWSGLNVINQTYWMRPLSFFMAWFFYKSGMFYKDRKCKEILLGGGKKLLIPYVLFSLIGHLLQCVKIFMEGDTNWEHYVLSPFKQIIISGSLSGNLALWFLPSLLAVQFLYTWLQKYVRDELIVLFGLVVAYTLHSTDICRPLYIGNVSLGLSVFAFGHAIREFQYKHLMFISFGILYLLLLMLDVGSIGFRSNGEGEDSYLLPVLFSLCGCIVINNLFQKGQWRIWILKYVGERAMSFYVIHWLVLLTCRIVLSLCGTNDKMMFLGVSILSCCVVLPLVTEALMKTKYRFVLGLR